jgi:hypothetical protein
MSIIVNGDLRKVIPAKTAKDKVYNRLSVLVDFGKYEDIIRIDDFSGVNRVPGACKLEVIPSSYVSKTGFHGINWKITGG